MKKKKILFVATGGSGWIGGLYYVKNILYQFLQYPPAKEEFDIYIYTRQENREVFKPLEKLALLRYMYEKEKPGLWYRFLRWLLCKKMRKSVDVQFWQRVLPRRFDVIYPYESTVDFLNDRLISWIPDFQYLHLQAFFSEQELRERTAYSDLIARHHRKLILSSQDALRDYRSVYPDRMDGVYVVPFVSAIAQEEVAVDRSALVKEKYGVSGKYFMVANQFWVHKNHMTLFRAIKRLVDRGHKDIRCVCTGALKDYRNQDYYESLETFLRENGLWDHIKILGFIDRKDQLQLMKNAVAVVQPSLFEGWGTVVEDAKTLQKVIVLSDIAVHQEQKNEDCILFGKNDDLQLAEILEGLWEEFRQKEVRHGYQLEKAAEYGKRFYDAITSGS